MSRDFVTVVSGLPRSGTSMLMRMLDAGGVPALTDKVRRPDDDNPLGYYELEVVKTLPSRPMWLDDAVGGAVKVVSALLERLPADRFYRVVFLQRDLTEVLASQRRMLEARGEPTRGVEDDAMANLFRKHLASVLEKARGRREMSLLEVGHADVLASPATTAEVLDAFLGGGLDCQAMAAAVEPRLWRQRSSATSAGG